MNGEKEEQAEAWKRQFHEDWAKEVRKLLAFQQTAPFRKVVTEINQSIDAILRKHFTDPRSRTIKTLVLTYLIGQALEEWVKPKDAPLAKVYRQLLNVVVHESSMGQLILERAMREGVNYTNEMVNVLLEKYKGWLMADSTRPHIVQPSQDE